LVSHLVREAPASSFRVRSLVPQQRFPPTTPRAVATTQAHFHVLPRLSILHKQVGCWVSRADIGFDAFMLSIGLLGFPQSCPSNRDNLSNLGSPPLHKVKLRRISTGAPKCNLRARHNSFARRSPFSGERQGRSCNQPRVGATRGAPTLGNIPKKFMNSEGVPAHLSLSREAPRRCSGGHWVVFPRYQAPASSFRVRSLVPEQRF